MPKVEWGKKVVCKSCEVKFYDLNRKYPLTCPNCGASVDEMDIDELSSNAKKVISNNVKSVKEVNLVGSDATESMASEDEIPMVDEDDTISLEEADQDEDVIDTDVDDLSIEQESNQLEED